MSPSKRCALHLYAGHVLLACLLFYIDDMHRLCGKPKSHGKWLSAHLEGGHKGILCHCGVDGAGGACHICLHVQYRYYHVGSA